MHRHSASMIAGDRISSPQVLICHEPTTDLDVTTWAEPMPFIPHDLNVAASLWTGGPCSAGGRSGKWCSRTRNWIRASRPASPFRTPATCMQSSRPQIHGGGPGTARPGGLDGTARRRQTPNSLGRACRPGTGSGRGVDIRRARGPTVLSISHVRRRAMRLPAEPQKKRRRLPVANPRMRESTMGAGAGKPGLRRGSRLRASRR